MINHLSTYLSMWKHGITYYLATTSTFAIGQTTQLCDLKVLGVVGCGGGGGGGGVGGVGGAGEGSRFNLYRILGPKLQQCLMSVSQHFSRFPRFLLVQASPRCKCHKQSILFL